MIATIITSSFIGIVAVGYYAIVTNEKIYNWIIGRDEA